MRPSFTFARIAQVEWGKDRLQLAGRRERVVVANDRSSRTGLDQKAAQFGAKAVGSAFRPIRRFGSRRQCPAGVQPDDALVGRRRNGATDFKGSGIHHAGNRRPGNGRVAQPAISVARHGLGQNVPSRFCCCGRQPIVTATAGRQLAFRGGLMLMLVAAACVQGAQRVRLLQVQQQSQRNAHHGEQTPSDGMPIVHGPISR